MYCRFVLFIETSVQVSPIVFGNVAFSHYFLFNLLNFIRRCAYVFSLKYIFEVNHSFHNACKNTNI